MAHPDLNALKDELFPVAQRMLTEYGEFFPFGAFMKLSGEIVDCSADHKEEHPPSKALIDVLTRDFRRRASKKEIRAAGICSDVCVARPKETEKKDAIHFALEHQNGEALDVFLPYSLDVAGEVVFGQLFATQRPKLFFTD